MQDNRILPASEEISPNVIAGQHDGTGTPRDRRSLHLVGSCVKHEEQKRKKKLKQNKTKKLNKKTNKQAKIKTTPSAGPSEDI